MFRPSGRRSSPEICPRRARAGVEPATLRERGMRSCEKPHQRVRHREFVATAPGEPILARPSRQQPASLQTMQGGEDTPVAHVPGQGGRVGVPPYQPKQPSLRHASTYRPSAHKPSIRIRPVARSSAWTAEPSRLGLPATRRSGAFRSPPDPPREIQERVVHIEGLAADGDCPANTLGWNRRADVAESLVEAAGIGVRLAHAERAEVMALQGDEPLRSVHAGAARPRSTMCT